MGADMGTAPHPVGCEAVSRRGDAQMRMNVQLPE
jgi:hypothetical protein